MHVTLADGTVVLAQGRLGLVASERPRAPDFALYLDARWDGDPDVTWRCTILEWEDFGLPADEEEFASAVVDLHRRAQRGELVEIACYGGIGRTGTVLACLAVLAGIPADEAVAWVRRHYHRSAVETAEQEQLIARFARGAT
jgi:hypothetical protein